MGRKGNKAKERRQKRKEENDKYAASQELVNKANALKDPMAELAVFKRFDRNGLSLSITAHKVTDLDKETVDWLFDLTKANMETLYESSGWGWNDKQKREEMTDENAWYLIAKDQENKPVAMVHFRFDIDEEIEVLYCYEIQLIKDVRKKGLGKFMMQILELMAHKTQMQKVMLTVFKANKVAQEFFIKKLKYSLDETTPEETMVEAMFDEEGYTYQILSKSMISKRPLGQSQKPMVKSQNQCNCCM